MSLTDPTVQATDKCKCGAPIGFVRVGLKQREVEVPFVRAYVWSETMNEWQLRRVHIAHKTNCPNIDVNLRQQ